VGEVVHLRVGKNCRSRLAAEDSTDSPRRSLQPFCCTNWDRIFLAWSSVCIVSDAVPATLWIYWSLRALCVA